MSAVLQAFRIGTSGLAAAAIGYTVAAAHDHNVAGALVAGSVAACGLVHSYILERVIAEW